MSVAKRLKWVRETAGLTQRVLAARCGVSEASLSHVERGESETLTTKTAEKVAVVLGCSLDWLLIGKGDPPAEENIRALGVESGAAE